MICDTLLRYGSVGRLAGLLMLPLEISMKIVVMILAGILFFGLGVMVAGVWFLSDLNQKDEEE